MSYEEFEELCGKSWDEAYNYLRFDRSKKRDQGRFFISNASKRPYIAATPQPKDV